MCWMIRGTDDSEARKRVRAKKKKNPNRQCEYVSYVLSIWMRVFAALLLVCAWCSYDIVVKDVKLEIFRLCIFHCIPFQFGYCKRMNWAACIYTHITLRQRDVEKARCHDRYEKKRKKNKKQKIKEEKKTIERNKTESLGSISQMRKMLRFPMNCWKKLKISTRQKICSSIIAAARTTTTKIKPRNTCCMTFRIYSLFLNKHVSNGNIHRIYFKWNTAIAHIKRAQIIHIHFVCVCNSIAIRQYPKWQFIENGVHMDKGKRNEWTKEMCIKCACSESRCQLLGQIISSLLNAITKTKRSIQNNYTHIAHRPMATVYTPSMFKSNAALNECKSHLGPFNIENQPINKSSSQMKMISFVFSLFVLVCVLSLLAIRFHVMTAYWFVCVCVAHVISFNCIYWRIYCDYWRLELFAFITFVHLIWINVLNGTQTALIRWIKLKVILLVCWFVCMAKQLLFYRMMKMHLVCVQFAFRCAWLLIEIMITNWKPTKKNRMKIADFSSQFQNE